MKNKSFSLSFLYGWLTLFSLVPLSLVFIASFLSTDALHLVTLPLTLANYVTLLSPLYLNVLFRSVTLAVMATLLCLAIAYPFSFVLVKSKHRSLLLLLIMIPFWTSSLVRTYALISILKLNGLLNALLLHLHLITAPITLLYTNFAVLLGLVYNLFPFMVLPILTNMERFNFQLIEAAKDLGANGITIFCRVFFPGTKAGVVSGCLMVFLPAMTLFYIPNVLGGARSILLGNLIQSQFLLLENWPQGAATSILLTLTLVLLLMVFRCHPLKRKMR